MAKETESTSPSFGAPEGKNELEKPTFIAVGEPINGAITPFMGDEEEDSATDSERSVADKSSRFRWHDLVVLAVFECIAVPICIAAGEAFVSEHYGRAIFGWLVGLPLAVAGFTAPWWKEWLSESVHASIIGQVLRWWPAAIFAAFIYVAGPNIYQRAVTTPPTKGHQPTLDTTGLKPLGTSPSPLDAPLGIPNPLGGPNIITGRDLLDAIKSLQSQLSSIIKERDTDRRELAATRQELESSRKAARAAQTVPSDRVQSESPMKWQPDLSWGAIGSGKGQLMDFIYFWGTNVSSAAVQIKEAYISSGLTGVKQSPGPTFRMSGQL